jgi:hypothetical protein
MRLRPCTFIAFAVAILFYTPAAAQSLAADVHFAVARWDVGIGPEPDYGVGGRLTWKPSPLIGLDADLTWYPTGFPGDTSISRKRFEGLFGATIGPRINGVRPFVKGSAGFLNVSPSGGAFACIAIFPPPISCILAGGKTLPAYELGGGVEIDMSSTLFLRGDVADRILRYPGPSLDASFEVQDAGYFEHGLRLTIGAGIRFK